MANQIDFSRHFQVDDVATEGFKAAMAGNRTPPAKYYKDDLLLCAWRIGNAKGMESRPCSLCDGEGVLSDE